jgi:hypothetical protein
MLKKLNAWLKGYKLTQEQELYAEMARMAARELDKNFMTATLSEYRRTVSILAAQLNAPAAEYDPLTDLLKR